MSEPNAGPEAAGAPGATDAVAPEVDRSVLERVTDDVLRETLQMNMTVKEACRALEQKLGLPDQALAPFKQEIKYRIANFFNMPGSDEPAGGGDVTMEGTQEETDGDKLAKKKKKKLKKDSGSEDEHSRKKMKQFIDDQAEDEDEDEDADNKAKKKKKSKLKQESDSEDSDDEEDEEDDEYEKDDFIVSDDDAEAEEESSSTSSSSSDSDNDTTDGKPTRRLKRDSEDFDLDADDLVLVQENLNQTTQSAPKPKPKHKPSTLAAELGEEEEEGDFQEGEGDGESEGGDENEFSSGESSGIIDSDDEGDFIEDDDLEDMSDDEREREIRRRRRSKRAERRSRRLARNQGLINLEDIPEGLQNDFNDCFALDDFDLFISEDEDDEALITSEAEVRRRLVGQEEMRNLFLLPEDEIVRNRDEPERMQLDQRKVEILINWDAPLHVQMQAHYVAKVAKVSPDTAERALRLIQQEALEPPCVHMYHADECDYLSLDQLWAVQAAGLDYQTLLSKLITLTDLIKSGVSINEPLEEKMLDDDFWAMIIESPMFLPEEVPEDDNYEKRNMQAGLLRLLFQSRLNLSHDLLDDFTVFIQNLLTAGEDRKAKQKASNGLSRQVVLRKFQDHLGTPLGVGLCLAKGYNDGTSRPKIMANGTPKELAEELFVQDYDPAELSAKTFANLLAREPHVRDFARKLFLEQAIISTKRTAKGMRVASEPGTRFYEVAFLANKPLEVYLKAFEQVDAHMADVEQAGSGSPLDVHRRHAEQGILLDLAQREGVIEVQVSNDSDLKHALVDAMQDLLLSSADDDWEMLRRKALKDAVDQLVSSIQEYWVREITKLARESLSKRCARLFFNRVFATPVNFATLAGPDENSGPIYADVPVEQRRYAALLMSDDSRTSPSIFVCVNHLGVETYRKIVDMNSRGFEDELNLCVGESEPQVIALNPHASRVRNVMTMLNRIARKRYERFTRKNKESDAPWKGWFVPYVVRDDLASAFASSPRGKQEFPQEHVNFRRAIALARYLADPVESACALVTDLPVGANPSPARELLLSITMHPLQPYVDQLKLLKLLEIELVNCVALQGVDINACVSNPHKTCTLAMVPGLGFRKALKLARDVMAKGRLLRTRGELLRRKLLGECVFKNAAGFLIVKTGEDVSDEWVEVEEDDDEEEASDDENDQENPVQETKQDENLDLLNHWAMRRSRLDLTRIHPLPFASDLAEAVCVEYCRSKMNGSTGAKAIAFVLRKLAEVPHDAGFLEKRQIDSNDLFNRTRSIHALLPGSAPTSFDIRDGINASLDDGFNEIFEDKFGRSGDYRDFVTLGALIIEELRFPFGVRGRVLHCPTDQEIAIMCAGEDIYRKDAEVAVEIVSMPRYHNSRFDASIYGRVASSTIKCQLRILDGDIVPSADNRFNTLNKLARNCSHAISDGNQSEADRVLDDLNRYLKSMFHLTTGSTVECTVSDPNRTPLRVSLKHADKEAISSAVDWILDDSAPKKTTWDEWFVPVREEEKPIVGLGTARAAKPAMRTRDLSHPIYRNWSEQETEEYLSKPERKVGDCILRPSPKSFSGLFLTYRWSKDPCKLETLLVEERNIDGSPKNPSDASIGQRLVIRDREYEAIDEIVAMFIEPIAKRVQDLQSHKNYRPMTLDEVEGLVRDQRESNPASIPYYMIPHSTEKRVFYLVYQNSNHGPKRLRVIVRPEGFSLVNKQGLRTAQELINYFKRNMRQLEEANARAAGAPVNRQVPAPGALPQPFMQQPPRQPPMQGMPPPAYYGAPPPPAAGPGYAPPPRGFAPPPPVAASAPAFSAFPAPFAQMPPPYAAQPQQHPQQQQPRNVVPYNA